MDYTKILLIPAIITFLVVVYNMFKKKQCTLGYYLRTFLIGFAICYVLYGHVFAFDFEYCSKEIKFYSNIEALTPQQETDIKKKIIFHKKEGRKHFNIAEQTALLIPDLEDQGLVKDLFVGAVTACATSPWSATVNVLISSVGAYCYGVYKQWRDIKRHLQESQHHFEMMEFYDDVIKYG